MSNDDWTDVHSETARLAADERFEDIADAMATELARNLDLVAPAVKPVVPRELTSDELRRRRLWQARVRDGR